MGRSLVQRSPNVCVSLSVIRATITRYTYDVWVESVTLGKKERKKKRKK